MPEWAWALLIGVGLVSLAGLVWNDLRNRVSSVEGWIIAHAGVSERLKVAEAEIDRLREWKHVRGEPYVNAADAMNTRVERLERKVLNGNH